MLFVRLCVLYVFFIIAFTVICVGIFAYIFTINLMSVIVFT